MLPVQRLGKHLAGAADEGAVRDSVALELVHHPGRRVAKIAKDADETRRLRGGAIGLARHVVMRRAFQGPLELGDTAL